MDIKEEYKNVCFSLKSKEKELDEIRTDIFILNQNIDEVLKKVTVLNDEIDKLKNRKEEIEKIYTEEK